MKTRTIFSLTILLAPFFLIPKVIASPSFVGKEESQEGPSSFSRRGDNSFPEESVLDCNQQESGAAGLGEEHELELRAPLFSKDKDERESALGSLSIASLLSSGGGLHEKALLSTMYDPNKYQDQTMSFLSSSDSSALTEELTLEGIKSRGYLNLNATDFKAIASDFRGLLSYPLKKIVGQLETYASYQPHQKQEKLECLESLGSNVLDYLKMEETALEEELQQEGCSSLENRERFYNRIEACKLLMRGIVIETFAVDAGIASQKIRLRPDRLLHYQGNFASGAMASVARVSFKNHRERIFKSVNPVQKMDSTIGRAEGIPSRSTSAANLAGRAVATYKIDQLLKACLVPKTDFAIIGQDKVGSCQVLVEGKQLYQEKFIRLTNKELEEYRENAGEDIYVYEGWVERAAVDGNNDDLPPDWKLSCGPLLSQEMEKGPLSENGKLLSKERAIELFKEEELFFEKKRVIDVANDIDFRSPALQKALANAQIMDLLTGQLDRNAGNFIYQQQLNGEWLVYLIDNDLSFPPFFNNLRKEKLVSISKQGPALSQLPRLIDQEMADRVLDLTPLVLKIFLSGTGLTKEELDATKSRLEELQHYIQSIQKGEVRGGRLVSLWNEETFQLLMEKINGEDDNYTARSAANRSIKEGERDHSIATSKDLLLNEEAIQRLSAINKVTKNNGQSDLEDDIEFSFDEERSDFCFDFDQFNSDRMVIGSSPLLQRPLKELNDSTSPRMLHEEAEKLGRHFFYERGVQMMLPPPVLEKEVCYEGVTLAARAYFSGDPTAWFLLSIEQQNKYNNEIDQANKAYEAFFTEEIRSAKETVIQGQKECGKNKYSIGNIIGINKQNSHNKNAILEEHQKKLAALEAAEKERKKAVDWILPGEQTISSWKTRVEEAIMHAEKEKTEQSWKQVGAEAKDAAAYWSKELGAFQAGRRGQVILENSKKALLEKKRCEQKSLVAEVKALAAAECGSLWNGKRERANELITLIKEKVWPPLEEAMEMFSTTPSKNILMVASQTAAALSPAFKTASLFAANFSLGSLSLAAYSSVASYASDASGVVVDAPFFTADEALSGIEIADAFFNVANNEALLAKYWSQKAMLAENINFSVSVIAKIATFIRAVEVYKRELEKAQKNSSVL